MRKRDERRRVARPWRLPAVMLASVAIAARGAQERHPEPPPAAARAPLRVEVVDAGGRPCGGAPVAVVLRRDGGFERVERDRGMRRRSDFLNAYLAVERTSDADGIATFDLAALALEPGELETCVVRLCMPVLDPVEKRFDPKQPPAAAIRLVRPDCGSVRIEVPGIEKGRVRVRAFDPDDPGGSIWNRTAPDCPIVAGVALVPFAAVGVELAYEATWDGLATPITGRFAGLRERAREEMRFAPPTLAAFPIVRGRLLDEEGFPVADRPVDVHVGISAKGSGGGSGGRTTTDAGGRFEYPLVDELPKGGRRQLSLAVETTVAEAKDPVRVDALVDLSKPLPAGPHEIGDVVLVAPGSLRWLARLSDDELLKTYETRRSTPGTRRIDVEACLVEMARRKSERWKKHLAAELAAARPDSKPKKAKRGRAGDDDDEPRGEPADDLVLLTALRRAQGKPDPLAIEIVGKAPFDTTFPETPAIEFRLKNVDSGKESFGITEGGSYRSGRFARLHVEAVDQNGARAPVITQFGIGIGGGMSSRGTLEFGESREGQARLGDYVRFPGPGNFEVRLSYHDDESIADQDRIEGYVVASSPTFLVRIRPQPIVATRAQVDALKKEFLAIDFSKKVPLVSGHWRPDLAFVGEPVSPEDRIFRAGHVAVPALLELLEDETFTIEQRSWIFGLLWDVTGMNNPTTGEYFAAVKDPEWIGRWPTSTEDARPGWNEFGKHGGGGWPEHQKGLAARWKSMRSWFDLKVTR